MRDAGRVLWCVSVSVSPDSELTNARCPNDNEALFMGCRQSCLDFVVRCLVRRTKVNGGPQLPSSKDVRVVWYCEHPAGCGRERFGAQCGSKLGMWQALPEKDQCGRWSACCGCCSLQCEGGGAHDRV